MNANSTISEIQHEVHEIEKSKGWWNEFRHPGVLIALCHSELSELLEAFRNFNKFPASDHVPEINLAEEEIADTIIRLLDMAEHCNLNIHNALIKKIEFNKNREFKHGGKAF